jgi:hypothetical protein
VTLLSIQPKHGDEGVWHAWQDDQLVKSVASFWEAKDRADEHGSPCVFTKTPGGRWSTWAERRLKSHQMSSSSRTDQSHQLRKVRWSVLVQQICLREVAIRIVA